LHDFYFPIHYNFNLYYNISDLTSHIAKAYPELLNQRETSGKTPEELATDKPSMMAVFENLNSESIEVGNLFK